MTTAVGAMAPDNMLTMMRKANPEHKRKQMSTGGFSPHILFRGFLLPTRSQIKHNTL
jgi:hypothetical protein